MEDMLQPSCPLDALEEALHFPLLTDTQSVEERPVADYARLRMHQAQGMQTFLRRFSTKRSIPELGLLLRFNVLDGCLEVLSKAHKVVFVFYLLIGHSLGSSCLVLNDHLVCF